MTDAATPGDRAKKAAAAAALEYVKPDMRLGLGTGSTAAWFVELLGRRSKAEPGLDPHCVPTSSRTAEQARACGLRVGDLNDVERLDLTIDGADEFDPDLNLVKGGGGALLQEKIVASASERMIVIADQAKRVDVLGAYPLPVEVTPFGWRTTRRLIGRALEGEDVASRRIAPRMQGEDLYVTDEGNHILDLHLSAIAAPVRLASTLTCVPGVVETGLFIGIASLAIVGHEDGGFETIATAPK